MRAGLLLLCVITGSGAQSFLPGVRVNAGAAGTAQRAPVVRCAPDGLIHVSWIDDGSNRSGNVLFTTSSDGGRTFGQPATVAAGGNVDASNQRRANFAVAADGSIHITWMDFPAGKQPDILYARSTDRGATFSAPVSVTRDSGKYSQDFPSIATGTDGHVYICFLDSREQQQQLDANVQLSFVRSEDNGATFSAPRRISTMPGGSGGTCECCATDIAVSASGEIAAVFRSNIANRRDIHLTRSRDGGATFDRAMRIQNEAWVLASCPVTGPRVLYDRDETAHIVWRDSRPSAGTSICYHAAVPVGSLVTPFNRKVSDSQSWSDRPELAITPGGVLLVAFEDGRGGTSNIRAVYSIDDGDSFSPSIAVEPGPPASKREFPSCVSGPDGARYVVWQDARRDAGDIHFAADTGRLRPVVSSVIDLLNPAAPTMLSISPNPVRRGTDAMVMFSRDQTIAALSGNGDERCSWMLMDVLGRTVHSGSADTPRPFLQLPVRELLPGIYSVLVHGGEHVFTGRFLVE